MNKVIQFEINKSDYETLENALFNNHIIFKTNETKNKMIVYIYYRNNIVYDKLINIIDSYNLEIEI